LFISAKSTNTVVSKTALPFWRRSTTKTYSNCGQCRNF